MGARITPAADIVLSGRLTSRSAHDVRTALYATIDAGSGDLVVDLADVEAVDSTGLGLLLGAHRRAGRRGRRLVLRNVSPVLHRSLRLTRLHRILTIERATSPSAR